MGATLIKTRMTLESVLMVLGCVGVRGCNDHNFLEVNRNKSRKEIWMKMKMTTISR